MLLQKIQDGTATAEEIDFADKALGMAFNMATPAFKASADTLLGHLGNRFIAKAVAGNAAVDFLKTTPWKNLPTVN